VLRLGRAFAALAVLGGILAATGRTGGGSPAALAAWPAQDTLASQRIYFVMPDRYANGDTANDEGGLTGPRNVTGYDPTDTAYYHGGDLKGLTANLERIKNLGFTALWVTPVLKQDPVENGSAAYHGYWGLDFTTVDPHLGTDADFKSMVDAAHALGLKVYLDVVVNHTADVIQLPNSSTYNDIPFKDCHGKFFKASQHVTGKFPCLSAQYMPDIPFVAPQDRNKKRPAWMNNPLNYHDRGNIDFGSCSQQCFEQGDFYGLDDLFTEKPNVMNGLAQVYASWITRFHVDGFRVDTAKHVNAAFFKLWSPKIRAAAKSIGVSDFPIFGEVTLNDSVDLSDFVRTRGVPQVLDFPYQTVASAYAAGASGAKGIAHRLEDDDYFRLPNGVDPAFPTFLGNHDMGRAAQQILSQAPGLTPAQLLQRVELGDDLLYLLRGAPVVMYGDEVGMIGTGGDQQARQDMFPTRVKDWQTQPRVGGPAIGTGSSLGITTNPLEAQLAKLANLRDAYPALATGASVVRYAKDAVLVVSRIDASSGKELVTAFNNGTAAATVSVKTATPDATWNVVYGTGAASGDLTLRIPPVSALVAAPSGPIPASPPPAPKLTVGEDDLSSYDALHATVAGPPAAVTFALSRRGGPWRRIAIDDSAPYRAFVDPAAFAKREHVRFVAIATGLDGKTAVSKIATFTPRP
jgi:glycosidase